MHGEHASSGLLGNGAQRLEMGLQHIGRKMVRIDGQEPDRVDRDVRATSQVQRRLLFHAAEVVHTVGDQHDRLAAAEARVDEPGRRRDGVVQSGLPITLLDRQAKQETLAVLRELGDPGDLFVGKADQGELIARFERVNEKADRLLGVEQLVELAHAARQIKHERDRDRFRRVRGEVADLLRLRILVELEILGVETSDQAPAFVQHGGGEHHELHLVVLGVVQREHARQRGVIHFDTRRCVVPGRGDAGLRCMGWPRESARDQDEHTKGVESVRS